MSYERKSVYLLYYFDQIQFSERTNIAAVTSWKWQNSLKDTNVVKQLWT